MATEEEINIPILEGRTEQDSVKRSKKHHKPLSLLPLVALIFYDVSGGPFGIEVRSLSPVHKDPRHGMSAQCATGMGKQPIHV